MKQGQNAASSSGEAARRGVEARLWRRGGVTSTDVCEQGNDSCVAWRRKAGVAACLSLSP